MRYDVLKFGRSELRSHSVPVSEVTDDVRHLARDMLQTMYRSNGIGLAAEQIGRTESMCVIHIPDESGEQVTTNDTDGIPMPLVLVNPRITEIGGEQVGQEGCLSFPEIFVNIKRAAEVTVEYVNLENRRCTLRGRGLLARAIQHELDHLDGVLLVDRMSAVQKVAVRGKLKRIRAQSKQAVA